MVCGLLGAMAGGGCASPVDVSDLAPLDGYDQWYRVEASGPVPGHGEGYRIIYANDDARAYPHEGPYRPGTVIVKEILDGGDATSPLDYIAVMRKLTPDTVP